MTPLEDRVTPDITFGALLTTEHVDVGLAYEEGEWDLHLHDETNDVEYAPDEALLFVGAEGKTVQPAGGEWEFLGAGAGGDVWALPQTQNPELLFLGVGAEEIEPGTFAGDITLSLKAVRGPGQFSLYATDAFGQPDVKFATSDGITAADAVTVFAGSHTDYNFAFTAVGGYEIDVEATATLPGGEVTSSGVVTYYFRVQNVLTTEHADVGGVTFEDGVLGLEVHDADHDIEYEPSEVLLFAGPGSQTLQPDDPQFGFTGASPGDDIWVLPEVQDPTILWPGFASEEVEPGTFAFYFEDDPRINDDGPFIRITLKDVRGPGQFSLFNSGVFGEPIVWMSTADGITDDDVFFILEGSHAHTNWVFTQPGIYELDLVAAAFLDDGSGGLIPIESEVFTYTFGVEAANLGTEDEPGIAVDAFTADGFGTLSVTYTITGEVGPFDLAFYRSRDGAFGSGDVRLDKVRIDDPDALTPGTHTLTLLIGPGANQVRLPGHGAGDPFADYFLLGVADPEGLLGEAGEDNAATFVGVYAHAGTVFVHGGEGADAVAVAKLSGGRFAVTFNGEVYTYPRSFGLDEVVVRSHDGDDAVSADGTRTRLTAWGGAGGDALVGGLAGDFLSGGCGDDVVLAGGGNDAVSGGSGDDHLDGGAGSDVLHGGRGADLIFGGAGFDVLLGGSGDDRLDGGPGFDVLFGGAGIDWGRGEWMFGIEL